MGGFKMFFKGSAAIFLMVFAVSACFQAPEFPPVPEISFNDIIFKQGETQFDQDSLLLSINFQDGDGDLGLRNEGTDTEEPFQDLWAISKANGARVSIDDIDRYDPVTFADRNTPPFDTLPTYTFPYYCLNYTIINEDTVYVQNNQFHYNIHVTYFVKKNGVYTEFDWMTAFDPICGESFNGRYPLLNNPDRERPLEGKLTYKMKSAGFELLFRQDTLKLEVYIIDRALNISNTISTPDFVLKNITVGG